MRILISIIIAIVASGCAGKRQQTVGLVPLPSPGVEMGGVRYPETVRAYHLGRLVDPHNPDHMHEAHTIYRIEADARWDLHPGEICRGTMQGAVSVDSSFSPAPLNDAVIAELHRQQDVTVRVVREASRLASSYEDLRTVVEDVTRVAKEQALTRGRIVATEERLKGIEEQLLRIGGGSVPGP